MNLYLLLKFVHVLGAVGVFAAFAVEWVSLEDLRRASAAEQARRGIVLGNTVRWVGAPSLLILLASGIYLASTAWSWEAGWIGVSMGSLVLIAILGGAINGRKVGALAKALPATGVLDQPLLARAGDPLLSLSLRLRMAITVGIIYLMTLKVVEAWKAVAVIAVALIGGAAATLPAFRRQGGARLTAGRS